MTPDMEAATRLINYGIKALELHKKDVQSKARIIITLTSGQTISGSEVYVDDGVWICRNGSEKVPFNVLAVAFIKCNWGC